MEIFTVFFPFFAYIVYLFFYKSRRVGRVLLINSRLGTIVTSYFGDIIFS